MTKKITLRELEKLHKPFNDKKEITIGGQYKLTIDKKFKKTKIQQMLVEFQYIIKELADSNVDMDEIIKNLISIQYVLILKYFTDFPFPKDATVVQLLAILDKLIDTGLYEEITNNFVKEEIDVLNSELTKFAKSNYRLENIVSDIALKDMENNSEDEDNAEV